MKPKKSGPKNWMNPESVHYMIQLYTVTEMFPLIIILPLKSGVFFLGFASNNDRGFKAYAAIIFGSFMNLIAINNFSHTFQKQYRNVCSTISKVTIALSVRMYYS